MNQMNYGKEEPEWTQEVWDRIDQADHDEAQRTKQAKTHLQNILTAAQINISRVIAWLDEIPHSKTRTSHFARLAPTTG